MSQSLILVGNGITAEILSEYIRDDSRYTIAVATVDDAHVDKGTFNEVACTALSQVTIDFPPGQHKALMAVGYSDLNRTRENLFRKIKDLGYEVLTYIHPDARVYCQEPIEEGSIIMPGAVIEHHAKVGKNSVIWCNTTIAHHGTVGEHCWIASGAVVSGQAKVGNNSFIGVNATIVNKVEIGEYNIVGAAAMIAKCTKPLSVYLARSGEPFRYSSEEYTKYFLEREHDCGQKIDVPAGGDI